MKTEEVWQWYTLWCGKMSRTRYKCTEEFIRVEYPEAVRVPGTMELRQVYERGDTLPNMDLYPHGVLDFTKTLKPAKD